MEKSRFFDVFSIDFVEFIVNNLYKTKTTPLQSVVLIEIYNFSSNIEIC